jgi:ABC-2 type transport system permease protein
MTAAIAAEWIKLWTTRTVWWALLAAAVLMAAAAGQYALYADNGDLPADLLRDGRVPAGSIAVLAVGLAQLAFAGLAMLVMTGEYSTGTIRATLAWVPDRGRLLLAKCTVVAAVTFVAGTLTGLIGTAVAIPLLGGTGDAGAAGILGDAVAIGGYLALIAVFATGLATALRGPVVTLVVILLLVVLLPPILRTPDAPVLNAVADALPGEAGGHFLRGDTGPYPAAIGLLILAGWAAAAALTGWSVLRRRDA